MPRENHVAKQRRIGGLMLPSLLLNLTFDLTCTAPPASLPIEVGLASWAALPCQVLAQP